MSKEKRKTTTSINDENNEGLLFSEKKAEP